MSLTLSRRISQIKRNWLVHKNGNYLERDIRLLIATVHHRLKNKFEVEISKQLRRAKIGFEYESERIPYILARHYIPDFVIKTERGKVYIETKGYLRPEDKSKLVAVKKMHPGIDLRIVFYSNNKKSIKWAEKHGFTYAIGRIPELWLDTM